MQVINTSSEPVKIEFDNIPQHIALKANPLTLKPGQKGLVEGTYDATKNQAWGYTTDMVKIKINGELNQNVYYAVSANLVEDFSGLSKDDLANAPLFNIESKTVELGKIPGSTPKDVEFKLRMGEKVISLSDISRHPADVQQYSRGSRGRGSSPENQVPLKQFLTPAAIREK